MEECFDHSAGRLDVGRMRRLWRRLRDLPRSAPDVMTHGDLTPGNVLVSAGRLAGVLDVGGLGPADPALDLVGGWHLLEAGPRRVFREKLDCGDLEWRGAWRRGHQRVHFPAFEAVVDTITGYLPGRVFGARVTVSPGTPSTWPACVESPRVAGRSRAVTVDRCGSGCGELCRAMSPERPLRTIESPARSARSRRK